eukprot:scaffold3929_cov291-Pinguiococcus_pyrenoidosus.AAC.1
MASSICEDLRLGDAGKVPGDRPDCVSHGRSRHVDVALGEDPGNHSSRSSRIQEDILGIAPPRPGGTCKQAMWFPKKKSCGLV